MLLINCQTNLFLTWSLACVITNSTGAGRFAITDEKLHVPVVTLSTQDNAKLIQQLKSGFKRTINDSNYQSAPKNTDTKPIFKLLDWSKFSRSEYIFCVFIWKWRN